MEFTERTGGAEHHPQTLDDNTGIWLSDGERPALYGQLDWVKSENLLLPFSQLAPRDFGSYVDLGTGTGTVLKTLAPQAQLAIGVDISPQMLMQVHPLSNTHLVQADASKHIPLGDDSIDLVTERMMLHDLRNPEEAVREAWRIVRLGGHFLASEYVTDIVGGLAVDGSRHPQSPNGQFPLLSIDHYAQPTKGVVDVLRCLFGLKHEPNRYLWTGKEFLDLVKDSCPRADDYSLWMTPERISVANWLEKSGFPIGNCKQLGILACLTAEPEVKREWGLDISVDGVTCREEDHATLGERYSYADSGEREAMRVDAHFYAAFAYVKVRKKS